MTSNQTHTLMSPRDLARFWAHVETQPNGCWQWMGCKDWKGYSHFYLHKHVSKIGHRIAYEHWKGRILEGLTIDHLCRNRACVNPDHMEAVTNRENVLRGIGLTAQNARKTHCTRGHILAGSNLYIHPEGRRRCRTCQRQSQARHRQKRNLSIELLSPPGGSGARKQTGAAFVSYSTTKQE